MPVSKPSKLQELIAGVREWLPGVKPRAVEWWETVRAEPGQLWASRAFRYGCLVAGGMLLLLIATTISGWGEASTPSARGPADVVPSD